jgi:inner membrane protein
VLFAALTFAGGHTDHRSFTHSLAAMAAFCAATYLICQPLLPYFAIGYASHLVLDITNHQSIRLFWPARIEASLGLCRAKGTVNSIMLVVGLVACVLLAAYRLAPLASSAVGAF